MLKKRSVFVLVMLAGFLSSLALSAIASEGLRPGEKNPVTANGNSLFRDDELLLLIGDPQVHKAYYDSFKPGEADLKTWSTEEHDHRYLNSEYALINGEPPAWSIERGRITNPLQDDVAYAFYRTDGRVAVELWEYPARQSHWVKLDGTTDTNYQSVDVAVGDLDMFVESDNYRHDEIVVARIGYDNGYIVRVDVLDQHLDSLASISVSADYAPRGVAVAVGDFNGDGNLDLAVAQVADRGTDRLRVDVYACKLDANGAVIRPIELEHKSSHKKYTYGSEVDMAAGDFMGIGRDAIAVHYGGKPNQALHLSVFDSGADFTLTEEIFYTVDDFSYHPQVKAALLYFKPEEGYDLSRRQLVLGFAYKTAFTIVAHRIDKWYPQDDPGWKIISTSGTVKDLSLATGNFVGHMDDSDKPPPIEQIAVSYWSDPGHRPELVVMGHPNNQQAQQFDIYYTWEGGALGGQIATAVIATDNDGDTYRLGTPAHIVLEGLISLDYVIQEPPKHVDYLPVGPDGKWNIINISAWDDFIVELEDDSEVSVETTAEDTSSWSMGGSVKVDSGATVSEGFGDIGKASESIDVKAKVGYDYDAHESSYNSQYGSRSVSYSNQTNIDDNVHAKIQTLDIWRYPIYALMTDDGKKHGFQEIILPGPYSIISAGAGKDHGDWYQPAHQNRNILSYPHFVAEHTNFKPPDLGYFTLPDKTQVHDIMNEGATHYWDGNKQTIKVAWTEKAGSGETKSYNHTLSSSLDITVGEKAKVEFFGDGVKEHTSVTVSFHDSVSWGGSKTEKAENSKSRGVTIEIPAQTGEQQGYAFQSAIYISSGGGTFKVAHATDPQGGQGSDWWKQYYGGKPDPALSLPNRFEHHTQDDTHRFEYWTLIEDYTRKKMRGFSMHYSKQNPISGSYDVIGASPVDGDVVKLRAKVYNYSLYQDTGDFTVRFYGIVVDKLANEVGDPFFIGEVRTSLDAIARPDGDSYTYEGQEPMKEVSVDWDTTGRSDTVIDGIDYNTYRFYVVVDEDDEVKNEIHEWKDADGNKLVHGNNEGYWPWKNAIQIVPEDSTPIGIDISIQPPSLAIKTDSGLKTQGIGSIAVSAGRLYELRVKIVSDGDQPLYRYALFYDGDPQNGGRVFSSQRVFGLTERDNYIWTEWTPKEPGDYELWAVVLEDSNDPEPGNNSDMIRVHVSDASNRSPVAHIDSISPSPATEDKFVIFRGHGTDPDRMDRAVSYHWTSNIDGVLSTSNMFATQNLSIGKHTIYLMVKDRHGAKSEQVSQTLVVNKRPQNQIPIAYIDSISPSPATEDKFVIFRGHGTDPDRMDRAVSYHWTSNIDGVLSTSNMFATQNLSIGKHTIYLMVKDRHGAKSEQVSQTLVVGPGQTTRWNNSLTSSAPR